MEPISAETIQKAAMQLFSQQGYEGTSLAQIAKQVGIKKPSIYAHFSGKADLFLHVFDQVLHHQQIYTKQWIEQSQHQTVQKRLYQILFSACQYFLEHEQETAFLKRAMLFPPPSLKDSLRTQFLKWEQSISSLLSSLFEEGIQKREIQPLDIENLLSSYYCLLDGSFIQLHYYGRKGFENRLDQVWKLFWAGIAFKDQGGAEDGLGDSGDRRNL